MGVGRCFRDSTWGYIASSHFLIETIDLFSAKQNGLYEQLKSKWKQVHKYDAPAPHKSTSGTSEMQKVF